MRIDFTIPPILLGCILGVVGVIVGMILIEIIQDLLGVGKD